MPFFLRWCMAGVVVGFLKVQVLPTRGRDENHYAEAPI